MEYKDLKRFLKIIKSCFLSSRYISDLDSLCRSNPGNTSLMYLFESEQKKYSEIKKQFDELSEEFEKLLDSCDDALINHCLMHYVLLNESWIKVAFTWGNGVTPDYMRINFTRYFFDSK